MATVTPNFNWPVPTSTDLVKDGATAIEALGDSIDASLVDLKGGTTGQVLSKASNTDMDFTWVTDAAGDITGVTAGTGLTGGGTSGAVSLAFDVANYGGGQYAAGKNKIINGDFNVWQRGTTFTNPAQLSYTADRFSISHDGTGATRVVSRQAFTPGAAPVAGYEGNYFYRYAFTAVGTGNSFCTVAVQKIEDVTTFAGQTVTISFWAKNDTSKSFGVYYGQVFGTGGSGSVISSSNVTIGTSWARYSVTFAIPSIAGKTIGTNSYLDIYIADTAATRAAFTLDLWGLQVEAGSTATPFQTATGTIQGELAACQRYYQQVINGNTQNIGVGWNYSSSYAIAMLYLPVVMRTAPTIAVTSGTNFYAFERNGGLDYVNAFFGAANTNPNNTITLRNSSEVSGTAGQAGLFFSDNASANISLSAEL